MEATRGSAREEAHSLITGTSARPLPPLCPLEGDPSAAAGGEGETMELEEDEEEEE